MDAYTFPSACILSGAKPIVTNPMTALDPIISTEAIIKMFAVPRLHLLCLAILLKTTS